VSTFLLKDNLLVTELPYQWIALTGFSCQAGGEFLVCSSVSSACSKSKNIHDVQFNPSFLPFFLSSKHVRRFMSEDDLDRDPERIAIAMTMKNDIPI